MQMLGSAQGSRQSEGEAPASQQQQTTAPSHSGSPAPAKTKRATGGKKTAKNAPVQEQQPPQSGEFPPMDFDDDIPF